MIVWTSPTASYGAPFPLDLAVEVTDIAAKTVAEAVAKIAGTSIPHVRETMPDLTGPGRRVRVGAG